MDKQRNVRDLRKCKANLVNIVCRKITCYITGLTDLAKDVLSRDGTEIRSVCIGCPDEKLKQSTKT